MLVFRSVESCLCASGKWDISNRFAFGNAEFFSENLGEPIDEERGCPAVCLWIVSTTVGANCCPTSSVYWAKSSAPALR